MVNRITVLQSVGRKVFFFKRLPIITAPNMPITKDYGLLLGVTVDHETR